MNQNCCGKHRWESDVLLLFSSNDAQEKIIYPWSWNLVCHDCNHFRDRFLSVSWTGTFCYDYQLMVWCKFRKKHLSDYRFTEIAPSQKSIQLFLLCSCHLSKDRRMSSVMSVRQRLSFCSRLTFILRIESHFDVSDKQHTCMNLNFRQNKAHGVWDYLAQFQFLFKENRKCLCWVFLILQNLYAIAYNIADGYVCDSWTCITSFCLTL